MGKKEMLEGLKTLAEKAISLTEASDTLGLNEYEVLGLVRVLREEGINIATSKKDDDIYLFNHGERELEENNTFKFVAIADTRFGSKSQQLSILNDIYMKAYENGYNNVILCGNISEGLYPMSNIYAESNFLDDTLRQLDYIASYYPYIDGIHTYFITGMRDEKHLKNNRINIGKRLDNLRDDMTYLGHNSCKVKIDNTEMLVFNPKLAKTYTTSYRAQQQVDSFRSEDKPDILLYGGLLQMEKFTYRNVVCISVPSVCATTREMNDRRYSNIVGAWYVDVKTDKYGTLDKIDAMDSVYYKTNKDDYIKYNRNILETILTAYLNDMKKHVSNETESLKIEAVYKSLPSQLTNVSKKFQYANISKNARAREYETAIHWLIDSNLILKCKNIRLPEIPLEGFVENDIFKLYLSDVGILNSLLKLKMEDILTDRNFIYKGIIAENYVANQFMANGIDLYYWKNENGTSEIDFLIDTKDGIIPIEVKASDNTQSKSLKVYMENYNPKYAIRISSKNFGYNAKTKIKSIPLYAVFLINKD